MVSSYQRVSSLPSRPDQIPLRVRLTQSNISNFDPIQLQPQRRFVRRQLNLDDVVASPNSFRLRRISDRHVRTTRLRTSAQFASRNVGPSRRRPEFLRRPAREEGRQATHGGRLLLAEADVVRQRGHAQSQP